MKAATLDCQQARQFHDAVRRGAEVLRDGGLVIFPTETVYGVGAATDDDAAVARLRQVKQRPDTRPFTIHMPGPDAVERYLDPATQPTLMRLVRKTMPGPITLIAEVEDDVIERKVRELGYGPDQRRHLYHENTIGLRCPDHPAAIELLAAVDSPVVASSANPAGGREPHDAASAERLLGDRVDLVLDGGHCRFAKPSTIVKVSGRGVEMIREGVFDRRYIDKLLHRAILFVCSGNTCRSPMAEAIARQELADRLGVDPDALEAHHWRVLSAGAFAAPGAPITPEAADALASLGIDPPQHGARALNIEMVQQAEAIFCMTEAHEQAVLALAPDAADRVQRLDPDGEIEDPMGSGRDVYQRCAQRLRQLIRQRLDQLGVPAHSNAR